MKKSNRRVFLKKGFAGTAGVIIGGTALAIDNVSALQDKVFNIVDFGAVTDGTKMNTKSIQNAINKCSESGGGLVIIPQGVFLTGGLVLKSNVDLHLERDAVLLGSPYMKDYHIHPLLNEARYSKYLRYALIFAQGAKNITVSGTGLINGNATRGRELGEFKDKTGVHERPCLLWFDECTNILVKDITYKNSAAWTETYSRCQSIHVDHITVTENYFFNADGCNMLDCENFIIENCDINTLDDGICLKGYTQDGCRNGIIRNNKVRSICNAIKMGTDSSGGFRDILIENNEVWQTGISGIALEVTDGGIMENVIVRNINMNVVATPIFIMLSNRNRPIYGQLTVPNGAIRNITIEGIVAVVDKATRFNESERMFFNDLIVQTSSVTGFPDNLVENISIKDVDIVIKGGFPIRTVKDTLRTIPEAEKRYPENRMFGTLPSYGFFIRNATSIEMNNIKISIEQEDESPAFHLEDVYDSVFDDISIKSLIPTPAFSIGKNCRGIIISK